MNQKTKKNYFETELINETSNKSTANENEIKKNC